MFCRQSPIQIGQDVEVEGLALALLAQLPQTIEGAKPYWQRDDGSMTKN